jgi:hypothetical protein
MSGKMIVGFVLALLLGCGLVLIRVSPLVATVAAVLLFLNWVYVSLPDEGRSRISGDQCPHGVSVDAYCDECEWQSWCQR